MQSLLFPILLPMVQHLIKLPKKLGTELILSLKAPHLENALGNSEIGTETVTVGNVPLIKRVHHYVARIAHISHHFFCSS